MQDQRAQLPFGEAEAGATALELLLPLTLKWAEAEKLSAGFLETLAKNGMKVQPPSPKLAGEYKELGKKLTAEWLEKAGADGKALVDAYNKN